MPAQKGKDLVLKMHNGSAFVTIAGLRSKTLTLSPNHANVSGTGIFRNAPSDELLIQTYLAGVEKNCQIVIPDFGTVEGPFKISSLKYTGAHDGDITFEIALESTEKLIVRLTD